MSKKNLFTKGEFAAAQMFAACLARHAANEDFLPKEIGFSFLEISSMACAYSDDRTPITARDFISVSLKILEGQISNISELTGIPRDELVQRIALAIALKDPNTDK